MANRRSVLIGLGGLVAGGGALLGTGAFTTVEAERTVNVETAGDADAFLGLEPAREDEEFVSGGDDGTIEINLNGSDTDDEAEGLNQNARTTFRNLVTVSNNGTEEVTSLTLEFTATPEDVTADDTFSFPVDDDGSQETVSNGEDILTGEDISDSLDSGSAVNFGIEVDLMDGGDDGDLPDGGTYTLTVTAETADSN